MGQSEQRDRMEMEKWRKKREWFMRDICDHCLEKEFLSRTEQTELRVFDCVDLRVVSIKCRRLHSRILRTCTRSTSQHRYHLQTLLWLLFDSRCLFNISSHFIFHFLSNLLWSTHSLGSRDVCNMLRIALRHNCVVLHAFIINKIGFYSRTENGFRLLRTSFLSEDVFSYWLQLMTTCSVSQVEVGIPT